MRSTDFPTHLGSTSMTANADGTLAGTLKYSAFGEVRSSSGGAGSDYRYTGQRSEGELGLYYYGARFYDPALARFVQADTIVPKFSNPLAWDRFAYTVNNPLRYTDPSGHMLVDDSQGAGCSTPGSPKCIIDKYYLASTDSQWLMDLELISYIQAYPDYDINKDPYLEGPDKAIVASTLQRANCANGSTLDCLGLGMEAGLGVWATGYAPYELQTESYGPSSQQQSDIWGDPDCSGCGYQSFSTGRTAPRNLQEQLALDAVRADPQKGMILRIEMTDPRWPTSSGWVKMSQNINGIEIHYLYNTKTGQVADFKFK